MILRKADISNLTIYGRINENLGNLSQYADEPTTGEIISDYFLGTTMILAFFISISLNPLIFLYNYNQQGRLKITRILFILLATSDFLTNLYRPLLAGYRFLSPDVYPIIRPKTTLDTLDSILFRLLVISSLILTSFISVCRFVSVKLPFFAIPSKAVLSLYISLMTGFSLISIWVTTGFPVHKREGVFSLWCQYATTFKYEIPLTASLPFLLHNVLAGILGLTGVVCSLQTVLCLKRKEIHVISAGANGVKTPRDADNNAAGAKKELTVGSNVAALRKSSQAILVMNIGNILMIIVLLLYTYFGAAYPLIKALGAFVLPIVLSATNPLVRIAFSKDIREFIWALVQPLVARIMDKLISCFYCRKI